MYVYMSTTQLVTSAIERMFYEVVPIMLAVFMVFALLAGYLFVVLVFRDTAQPVIVDGPSTLV